MIQSTHYPRPLIEAHPYGQCKHGPPLALGDRIFNHNTLGEVGLTSDHCRTIHMASNDCRPTWYLHL